jgi:hypothetical protein
MPLSSEVAQVIDAADPHGVGVSASPVTTLSSAVPQGAASSPNTIPRSLATSHETGARTRVALANACSKQYWIHLHSSHSPRMLGGLCRG